MKNIFWNVLHQNSNWNMLELWFGHVLQILKSVGWLFLIMGAKWSDARAAWNFRIHEQGESTRLKILIP